MDFDTKVFIMIVFFIFVAFAPLIYDSYSKNQCRIEALKQNKSAEDIEKICK